MLCENFSYSWQKILKILFTNFLSLDLSLSLGLNLGLGLCLGRHPTVSTQSPFNIGRPITDIDSFNIGRNSISVATYTHMCIRNTSCTFLGWCVARRMKVDLARSQGERWLVGGCGIISTNFSTIAKRIIHHNFITNTDSAAARPTAATRSVWSRGWRYYAKRICSARTWRWIGWRIDKSAWPEGFRCVLLLFWRVFCLYISWTF